MISYEDAIAILENADPQRAADYRTVINAVDRLPMLCCNEYGHINVWTLVRDTYKRGAVQDALKVLSEQYLADIQQKVASVTDTK